MGQGRPLWARRDPCGWRPMQAAARRRPPRARLASRPERRPRAGWQAPAARRTAAGPDAQAWPRATRWLGDEGPGPSLAVRWYPPPPARVDSPDRLAIVAQREGQAAQLFHDCAPQRQSAL